MSEASKQMSARDRKFAERIKALRADGFSWSQISRQFAVNIDRAKDLLLDLQMEGERKKARRAKIVAIAQQPSTCRYRVRRKTVWQNRCQDGVGPCICQRDRRKF